jgi:hypothetical protein
MKLDTAADIRPFHRSEAFPEDVADLVESATVIAATRNRPEPGRRWLSALLPVAAIVAAGALLLPKFFG